MKAALEALADLLAPHAEGESVHALETHYESGRYVKCPACGAEQGSGLAECAECGLALGLRCRPARAATRPSEDEGAACAVCGGGRPRPADRPGATAYTRIMADWWTAPEGVHVLPDGGWRVGGFAIVHEPSLRYLKARLVFEEERRLSRGGPRAGAGARGGPGLRGDRLRFDEDAGEAWVTLDDGNEEPLAALSLNEETGRFECLVREGQGRAVLSRGAHQALLSRVEEDGGLFVLRVGSSRISVRT